MSLPARRVQYHSGSTKRGRDVVGRPDETDSVFACVESTYKIGVLGIDVRRSHPIELHISHGGGHAARDARPRIGVFLARDTPDRGDPKLCGCDYGRKEVRTTPFGIISICSFGNRE